MEHPMHMASRSAKTRPTGHVITNFFVSFFTGVVERSIRKIGVKYPTGTQSKTFQKKSRNGTFSPQLLLDQASGLTISWEILNSTITFQASINQQSWFGLGFHCVGCSSDQPMQNADFVVSTFGGNGPTDLIVWDMFSNPGYPDKYMPVNDTSIAGGEYNILFASGYQTADYTVVTFSRLLDTGDNVTDHTIVPGPLDLVWAYGSSNEFEFHNGNAGRVTVDLTTGQGTVNNGPDYVDYHAAFMTVAFGLLMPFGVFVGRYLKAHMWWFPLHIIIQSIATIFAIIGFSLALKMVGGLHFTTVHAIMGFITLCLMMLSVLFGALSHFLWDPLRKKIPLFPDIMHWIGGRLVVLCGIVTIILGMVLYPVPQALIVVFGITVGLYFFVILFIDIYHKVYPDTIVGHGHETQGLLTN
ncbi:cytochrome b561 / ferric reductase transmembrane domain-containing protein [Cavenderia fasciculata]|uniref:Cytochrome b561 / ferric reductase transmembrane domain-containing protein n=1 Tax=Cavenderia fasciculata TaxID=261658 RepID=F4QD17_CACFS|nr:cytochrome b561 / ferric reductase transmembrane domain-containing protein [Cavenderia fasciculata]EGG13698.1 cytochrome b561 / ferric reductase transmembrane domain-containing protein [Cavenderia fasciculata]|eukprot:XP_004350402.1 cytochrome b561 / ferric reductase transmembrane domain-containing protein [Cavenderia fasciculata]